MKKTPILAALVLALTTAIAVPAAAAREDAASFPMPAATFQQHVDARLARARARMEQHITERGLSEAQARDVRARFDAVAAEVQAEVGKAAADGTVTLDEAKAVRAVAKKLHHSHDHGGAARDGV